MRSRSSAALALVTALLASPAAALACGFDCWPTPAPVATVEAVEAPPAEGSCHREAEEPVDGSFTLRATPHDCSSHSAVHAGLTSPNSASLSSASGASAARLTSGDRYGLSAAPSRVSPSPDNDLAPPGRTSTLFAPLRI